MTTHAGVEGRSVGRRLAGWWRATCGLCALLTLMLLAAVPTWAQENSTPPPATTASPSSPASSSAVVRQVRVDGPITTVTADYLGRALDIAEREEAAALLLELDTPGGSVSSMLAISRRMLNAEVPTVVWVGPQGAQAASAGTFIVLAAHGAGMAPRTVIGAASPVGGGGEELPETASRKATEDLAASARTLAARRGPEAVAWAERAVREAVSATADEALALGVIDAVAEDPAALLGALDGQEVEVAGRTRALDLGGAEIRPLPRTAAERLLEVLVHPAVALLLLTIGVNGILIELSSPGGFIAGAVGVSALVLGFYSLGALEANLVGLIFIGVALALFALETQTPTFGLLTAGGALLFAAGAVILFAGGAFGVPWVAVISLTAGTVLFFVVVIGAIVRTLRTQPTTGAEGLVGAVGTTRGALDPRGTVHVRGELWAARRAEPGPPVPSGASVRVTAVEGLTLRVAPVEPTTDDAAATSRASRGHATVGDAPGTGDQSTSNEPRSET